MGPKPYMEDEYICVDDLRQHLDPQPDSPLHGAFYGVTLHFHSSKLKKKTSLSHKYQQAYSDTQQKSYSCRDEGKLYLYPWDKVIKRLSQVKKKIYT